MKLHVLLKESELPTLDKPDLGRRPLEFPVV
jgi:hypothetical protein